MVRNPLNAKSAAQGKVRAKPRARRKRRVRNHIIESINYFWLGLIVSRTGHVIDVPTKDYGTDCIITTHDPKTGFPEAAQFRIQLKATDSYAVDPSGVVKFDADTRDLRSWAEELDPRFLIVFDVTSEAAVWVHVQEYLATNGIDPEALNTKTMVVNLPVANVVDEAAVELWRGIKNKRVKELWSYLNA